MLILLYTPDKKAFLGFVPNNQGGFVDRLRKVIQQKQQNNGAGRQPGAVGPGGQQQQQQMPGQQQHMAGQQMQQQGQMGGGGMVGGGGGMSGGGGMPGTGMSGGSMSVVGNMTGGNMPVGMAGNMPMQGNMPAGMQGGMQGGMGGNMSGNMGGMGNPMQGNMAMNQAGVQNQNLSAVQPGNQVWFKGRLILQIESETICVFVQLDNYGQLPVQMQQQDNSGMPMAMQMLQQQRVGMQNAQQPNQQQMLNAQRMMRPVMPNNNPGLRHLLQQQVIALVATIAVFYTNLIRLLQQQTPNAQYRPVLGMQQQQQNPTGNLGNAHMGGGGVRPNNPNIGSQGYDESNFDFMWWGL